MRAFGDSGDSSSEKVVRLEPRAINLATIDLEEMKYSGILGLLTMFVCQLTALSSAFAGPGDVVITEIMYKARLQQYYVLLDALKGRPWWESGDNEGAEYVEIYNRGAESVDLSGWEFTNGIVYEFSEGTWLGAGEYLVVCADVDVVKQEYGIENAVGNYNGLLVNRGERLTLVDASQPPIVIDTVRYRDDPPWPLAPDQEGRALECMDPSVDNERPENWRASRRLDILVADAPEFPAHGDRRRVLGGTPGQPNTVHTSDGLPPFVQDFVHEPARPSSLDEVTVSARVTGDAAIAAVSLHYEIYRAPFPYEAPVQTGDLDMLRGEGNIYEATLVPRPSQTLVRYRIEASDVLGRSWIYPDEQELSPHRSYWVYDGEQDTELPAYFLIFSREAFDKLNQNVLSKDTVEATFIADGIVYDHIQTRYRGCRKCPKKSYKVKLNRHELLRDMNRLDLNADWPIAEKVGYNMFWMVGESNLGTELVRLVRNGEYAGVMLALDSPNGSWARRRGLSEDIELYKAREGGNIPGVGSFSPSLNYFPDHPEAYPRVYIKRGDSLGSFQTLIDFTRDLSELSGATAAEYLDAHVDVDSWIRRVTVHQIQGYCDFHVKNYYVLRTPDPGARWNVLFFDIDGYWGATMGGFDCRGCEDITPFCSGNVVNVRFSVTRTLRDRSGIYLRESALKNLNKDRVFSVFDRAYERAVEDREEELATVEGAYVPTAENIQRMKDHFSARQDFLISWLSNLPVGNPENQIPTLRLARPRSFDPDPGSPVLIEWEARDAEGDPALVDLYWTDFDWSYLQPIVTGIPASAGRYGWNEGVPVTDKDIYVHAVIRDGKSRYEARRTSDFVVLEENFADDSTIPVISPEGGNFTGEQEVALQAPIGARAYYTLDGTDPRVSSTRILYMGPFRVASSVVVRSASVIEGATASWNLSSDWSDANNPNGPWTYSDGLGMPIETRQSGWVELEDAWAGAVDGGSGWAVSKERRVEPDLPAGSVFTLGDTTLQWTSPVSGEIEIRGALWLAGDRRRKMSWVLSQNGEPFTERAGVSRSLGISSEPFAFANGTAGLGVLTRTVEVGDVIELGISADQKPEVTGVHLEFVMSTKDLASSVSEVEFTSSGGGLENLKITEIMYQASTPDLDFIELKNTGSSTLDLFEVGLTQGVQFRFRSGKTLAPGDFVVLVQNINVFETFYGDVSVDGTYQGSLDNGGERLVLVDRDGFELQRVDFDDEGLWPVAADGFGHSLVLDRESRDGSLPEHWRASAVPLGSPGQDDPSPEHGGIWINEILTQGGEVAEDAIELFNATTETVDLGGWYLSDDRSNVETLKKFRIPDGTLIEPRGFVTVYEESFNSMSEAPSSFSLADGGGSVFLSAGRSSGALSGSIVGHYFEAGQGLSFGLARTTHGLQFTALEHRTFGITDPTTLEEFRSGTGDRNSPPAVGPIVLQEILYDPDGAGGEYLEFRNIGTTPISLHDDMLSRGWRVDGLRSAGGIGDFEFSPGARIEAGGYFLVVDMDPELFRVQNNVPAEVPIFGPFGGALDDVGETLRLLSPTLSPDVAGVTYAQVERVDYGVDGPWPTLRPGESLDRLRSSKHGNDPSNWIASTDLGGTPGRGSVNELPEENLSPLAHFEYTVEGGGGSVLLDALTSTDLDGQVVSYRWMLGNDAIGEGQWLRHDFGEGVFEVTLTVTDDLAATDSISSEIVVSARVESLPGDANADGGLDLSDAVKLLLLIFDPAGRELPCEGETVADAGNRELLDFDGNDNVDVNDALGSLRYLFLGATRHVLGTRCAAVVGCDGGCF